MSEAITEEKVWVKLPARIHLTQGQVALIDSEDYPILNQWKWFAHWSTFTKTYYAVRNIPTKNKKQISKGMHRIIMKPPNNKLIDHINHNTLDNRKANLRIVTRRINNQNQRKHRMWPVGVYWNKNTQGFIAGIKINSFSNYLGYFLDPLSGSMLYKFVVEELERLGVD